MLEKFGGNITIDIVKKEEVDGELESRNRYGAGE